MLVTCIVMPAAAALATAFSTHASTVCMSVSFTGLTAVQMGHSVSASLPKQTLNKLQGGLYTLQTVHVCIDCSAKEPGKHVGRFRKPYRPVQNEGWVSKERGARTGSLF